jgi:hypothetical protein
MTSCRMVFLLHVCCESIASQQTYSKKTILHDVIRRQMQTITTCHSMQRRAAVAWSAHRPSASGCMASAYGHSCASVLFCLHPPVSEGVEIHVQQYGLAGHQSAGGPGGQLKCVGHLQHSNHRSTVQKLARESVSDTCSTGASAVQCSRRLDPACTRGLQAMAPHTQGLLHSCCLAIRAVLTRKKHPVLPTGGCFKATGHQSLRSLYEGSVCGRLPIRFSKRTVHY